MLCSANELGIAEEAEGLLLLPKDAPTGEDFRNYYDLDDKLFTLNLTPNRADCLGMLGVAREVAAISSEKLILPEINLVKAGNSDALTVCIDEPDCMPVVLWQSNTRYRFGSIDPNLDDPPSGARWNSSDQCSSGCN